MPPAIRKITELEKPRKKYGKDTDCLEFSDLQSFYEMRKVDSLEELEGEKRLGKTARISGKIKCPPHIFTEAL